MNLLKKNITEFNNSFRALNYSTNPDEYHFKARSEEDVWDFYDTKDAAKICQTQAQLFIRQPTHLSLYYHDVVEAKTIHQQFITHANMVARKLMWRPKTKPFSGTLVVLGAGAGYQILELIKHINYRAIIIVEPNEKILNLLINNLDLEKLRNNAKNPRTISFITAKDYTGFKRQFKRILQIYGFGLLADISLFRHYNTTLFDKIYCSFKIWRNEMASMWGFFEDELMGINHTIENIKIAGFNNYLANEESNKTLIPVIVGNGPSLDDDLPLLKQYSKQLLIVSCGTSITTLLKHDIVPNIHVEMERTLSNYTLKIDTLHDPRLKATTLIGLNTIAPQLLKCFNHHILFAKAHDAGALLIQPQVSPLFHCNPTVTNMAASALCRLGFHEQVLVGCDYGYLNPQKHHSLDSDYFNQHSQLSHAKFSKELTVEGNFTPRVYTNRIFHEAKIAIENLLSTQKCLKIFNCSHGAKILGAVPITLQNKLSEIITDNLKQKFNAEVHSTVNKPNSKINNRVTASSDAQWTLKTLIRQIDQCTEVDDLINILNLTVTKMSAVTDTSKYLFVGSIKYITTTISGHVNHIPEEHLNNYFDSIQQLTRNAFLSYLTQLNIKEHYEV